MRKRVAIYARVSTSGQTTENQTRDLEKLAEMREWEVVKVYEDVGLSGALPYTKRPALKALLADARRRRFDLALFWAVDRLGRSTAHVTSFMLELRSAGVEQFYFKESMDTSAPHGEAMLEMAAVFAKLERRMIQERVKAGLERARATGKTLGRPMVPEKTKTRVLEAKGRGLSVRKIAEETGVSVGAVHKILKAA